MGDAGVEQDADPIKASYDVYIKPHLSEDREIYILQYPNRDARQQYKQSRGTAPLKMRIKPKAGMVEMDVPMDAFNNYDQKKGLNWGEAMKNSASTKGAGSHGLPGGFGIGGAPPSGRGRGRGNGGIEDTDALQKEILSNYRDAVATEKVLVKQTLGGQCVPKEDTSPQYMIGTFHDNQLHLTPVDNIVQMRPQFHHIDAQSEQERFARGRDTPLGPRADARAIHMTVKSNVDGEEDSTDTMPVRIQAAQSEAWKSHRFIDEDDTECWDAFDHHLFVGTKDSISGERNEDILAQKPILESSLNDAEYLDEISAPMDAAKLSRSQKVKRTRKGKGKEKAGDAAPDGVGTDTEGTFSDASLTDSEDEDEPEGPAVPVRGK